MTILQILPYSYPSGCGIWSRALNDSKILTNRGYILHAFSSNILKGTKQKLSRHEEYSSIKIHRFPILLKLGGSAMFFSFFREFFKVNPDVVIVHGYRHPSSLFGLVLAKFSRKKVFMTTHAPFGKDPRRSIFMKLIDIAYDVLIGWWELRLYNKIIMVAKWEEEVLKKRFKLSSKRLIHISNSIAEEFIENSGKALEESVKSIEASFSASFGADSAVRTPPLREGRVGDASGASNPSLSEGSFGGKVPQAEGVANFGAIRSAFYMGRIDPTKRPDWVLAVAKELPDYNFYIGGPINNFDKFESDLKNVEIKNFVYQKSDFIDKAKNNLIFLMPSVRETFGLTMVEAMSQACIVISSDTKGAREFVIDGQNGFIVNSPEEMVKKLKQISDMSRDELIKLIQNSVDTAKKYDSRVIGEKLVELIGEDSKNTK